MIALAAVISSYRAPTATATIVPGMRPLLQPLAAGGRVARLLAPPPARALLKKSAVPNAFPGISRLGFGLMTPTPIAQLISPPTPGIRPLLQPLAAGGPLAKLPSPPPINALLK